MAWLRIRYAQNLDRFYRSDYQRNLVLNAAIQYATFDFSIDLNANYRQVENAIYTPDCFKRMITEAQPLLIWHDAQPVSYTHLDVYKRQTFVGVIAKSAVCTFCQRTASAMSTLAFLKAA